MVTYPLSSHPCPWTSCWDIINYTLFTVLLHFLFWPHAEGLARLPSNLQLYENVSSCTEEKKGWLCGTYFNYSGRCGWFLFKSLWKCGENLALSLLILIAVTSREDNILLDKAVVFFFNCFSIQEDRWTWSCRFNKNLFLRCLFLLSVCQLFAHFSEVILFIWT